MIMAEEFINEFVTSYLNDTHIKTIKGCCYNPHSKGLIKLMHNIIRKALESRILEIQNNFDIEKELPLIMNAYNNSI